MKDDCIFCKLANGMIPTSTLYEDELFKVIFDSNPASKGHALIIPKEHYENVYELGSREAERVMPLAAKLGKALFEETGCDGLNVLQNNGTAAGQTVFHFHVHLIPRSEGDTVNMTWNQGEPDADYLCDLTQRVNRRLQK